MDFNKSTDTGLLETESISVIALWGPRQFGPHVYGSWRRKKKTLSKLQPLNTKVKRKLDGLDPEAYLHEALARITTLSIISWNCWRGISPLAFCPAESSRSA